MYNTVEYVGTKKIIEDCKEMGSLEDNANFSQAQKYLFVVVDELFK